MAPLVSKLMGRTRPCTKEELRALDGERVNLVYTSVMSSGEGCKQYVINFIGAVTGELVASSPYVHYVRDGMEYRHCVNDKGILYVGKATRKQPNGPRKVSLSKKQFLTVAERLKQTWEELEDPEDCWEWHRGYVENVKKYGDSAGVLGGGG